MEWFPYALLQDPPKMMEPTPEATWLASLLSFWKSVACPPLRLPPTVVPSGTCAEVAPVPLACNTALMWVSVPCASHRRGLCYIYIRRAPV